MKQGTELGQIFAEREGPERNGTTQQGTMLYGNLPRKDTSPETY